MSQATPKLDLFGRVDLGDIETQGIKYIGSKLKILPYILEVAIDTGAKRVFDGFTGSTRVAQALAKTGCDVIASDISRWSEVFATCYLQKNRSPHIKKIIDDLNKLKPVDGWFTEHYGGSPDTPVTDGNKRLWQRHNTRKLDAIRERIDEMNLCFDDESVLLTSLMLALDRVDNTLGHFASYLKNWSARSYNAMLLKEPIHISTTGAHRILRGDIFDVAKMLPEVDLAYLDPPYGSNNEKMPPSRVRYASYYHIWTTICLNDQPEIFGKAARREDTRDNASYSVFEDYRRGPNGRFVVLDAMEKLISVIPARKVLLSYSSGGRATTITELKEMLNRVGNLERVIEIEYKRNVMSEMKWTNEWVDSDKKKNIEYLFLVDKR